MKTITPILSTTLLSLFAVGCPKLPTDQLPDTTSGPQQPPLPPPPLQCPGETQCPCPPEAQAADESGVHDDNKVECPGDLKCGPQGACTRHCRSNDECNSGVGGELCLGGICAVVCQPSASPSGGCVETGMPGATCREVLNTMVCGYGDQP